MVRADVQALMLLANDLKNAKGMWGWLKENDAPGEYVYAVRNLIETLKETADDFARLEDENRDLKDKVERTKDEIRRLHRIFSEIQHLSVSASGDLEAVLREVRRLAGIPLP